jgi:BlaI family transcriptional regulator, penicillinase repressor
VALTPSFSDRELDVMAVLWSRGPSTVTEVREALHDELAYTTVLTVLRILEDKGHIAHREDGRAHRYHALVKREAARASALKRLTEKLFDGSVESLMTHLVAGEKLSASELAKVQRMLDAARKRKDSR